jgi:hypothetical protein
VTDEEDETTIIKLIYSHVSVYRWEGILASTATAEFVFRLAVRPGWLSYRDVSLCLKINACPHLSTKALHMYSTSNVNTKYQT